jgi:hypothetical protein
VSYIPDTHRRLFIAALVIALVLLAGSLGVAKSASTAAPERPAAIVARVLPPSARLRGAIETASLGSGRETGVPSAAGQRPRP